MSSGGWFIYKPPHAGGKGRGVSSQVGGLSHTTSAKGEEIFTLCFVKNIGAGRLELPTIELKAQRSTTELSTLNIF